MNPKGKKFIVILILCIVAGVVFFYTQNKTVETSDEVLVAGTVEDSVDNEAMYKEVQSFMQLFSSVTSIVVDTSLFQSPAFNFLKDNSVYIDKQPIGRSNPFLPIFTSITKGSSNSSTKAPIIDDSTLTIGEKVAIEVVTKVADFIDTNNIKIPIFGNSGGGGGSNGGSGGGGNGDNPPPPPPLKRPALFDTTVKGIIDDVEAKRVIGVIKKNCGVDLNEYIDIQKDITLPFPSYKIQGSQVAYNGDKFNNTALYAVSRISEDLFDATMIYPADDAILCKKTLDADQIKNVLGAYKKEWKPDYYIMNFFNVPGSKNEQAWFGWHHLPTGGPGENRQLYNQSDTFKGVAKEHPQVAPFSYRGTTITEESKFDVTHPDVPKIIYDRWASRSNPNFGNDQFVNLFELDGTRYDQLVYKFPMPEGLNPHEKDTFQNTILNVGIRRSAGNAGRYKGSEYSPVGGAGVTTYTISQEFVDKLSAWLPFYNDRVVLTPFYLESYKNTEKYFQQQGVTNVRYMIYAYSAYYYMPPGTNIDLSNFDVFYTSPGSSSWTRAGMEADLLNWKRWEATGANMIWRPNLWFKNGLDPHLNFALHNEFVVRAKPDGYFITGYTPGAVPAVQGVNFYTMFRTLQGRSPEQAYDDYINSFHPANQPLVRRYVQIAENTVQQKGTFDNSKLAELEGALAGAVDDPMMNIFKKGIEVTKKKNEYAAKRMSAEEFTAWAEGEYVKYPGLGNVGRLRFPLRDVPAVEY
jgi:hypothetical protein